MKDTFEIKIEKGIPLVERRSSGITIALKKMNVGDSFLYPENKRTHIAGNAMRSGIKTVSRKVGDGMVRIWRVK